MELIPAIDLLGGAVPGYFAGGTGPEYVLAGIIPVRTTDFGPVPVEKGAGVFLDAPYDPAGARIKQ